MKLILTPEQTRYLNRTSPLKADTLKRVYKKSVQEQQKTLKTAQQLRRRKK